MRLRIQESLTLYSLILTCDYISYMRSEAQNNHIIMIECERHYFTLIVNVDVLLYYSDDDHNNEMQRV